jgi:transcriptional regulator with XRE-family HTH domain
MAVGIAAFSGARMREARIAKGWSQPEFSYVCHVAQPLIWRYEHDLSKPSRTRLHHLASALGVSAYDLVDPDAPVGLYDLEPPEEVKTG